MALGCGRDEPPNLVIISLDTIRADVLDQYGRMARIPVPVAPNLDDLASESVVLTRCYTPSPRTTQAMASLFTGEYPTNHGAFGLFHTLSPDATTLAEVLAAAGYRTQAVVTNHFLQSGRGFEQGFQVYDDYAYQSRQEYAEDVVSRADLQTLEPPDGPFFLWFHFLDPHWTYDPPPQALRQFDTSWAEPFTLYADIDSAKVTRGEIIFENELDADTRRRVQRRYLAEISYMDGHVRRLIEMLRNRGYLENTILVVVADHGESMGEHDYYYAHGETLVEGTVRVPAIVNYPGHLEPGRLHDLASLVDFTPTLLSLMDVETDAHFDGVDLSDALRKKRGGTREVTFLESDYQLIHPENPDFHYEGPRGKWRAVVAGDFKLVRIPDPNGDRYSLYDVVRDPDETNDLIDEARDVVAQLTPMLEEWDAIVDAQVGAQVEISDEVRERLRSLGYLD